MANPPNLATDAIGPQQNAIVDLAAPLLLPLQTLVSSSSLTTANPPLCRAGTGTGTGTDTSQSRHIAASPTPSCTLCRQRKVRCDRAHPCGNCQRTGAECVQPARSHIPRGRQGGRKRKRPDGDMLLMRVAKLEGLVKHFENLDGPSLKHQRTVERPSSTVDSVPANGAPTATSTDVYDNLCRSADDAGGTKINASEFAQGRSLKKGLDRYVGASFWTTLSEEINGLRDVLCGSSDYEDEGGSEQTPESDHSMPAQPLSRKQISISGCVISPSTNAESPSHPSCRQVYTLCDIYLANVDPVFKLLHGPSLRRYLQDDAEELDGSAGREGLEALRFAIYYAAVVSMTDEECGIRVGEGKSSLVAKYRAGTEQLLAKADFINTTEMSTLQALTIYLVRAQFASQLHIALGYKNHAAGAR